MKMTNTVAQNKILAKISSAPITKIMGHGEVAKTLNREAMLEKLGHAKTARKSLKVRKIECWSASSAEIDTA